MATGFYAKGKQKILNGDIDFDTDTIKVRLVKNTYTENLTTDEFVSSVTKITGTTDQTLTSPSITNGVFDAADVTFTAVPSGENAEAVVLYKFVTNDADSPVIAFIDSITGFPFPTNGGNVVIQWDNGASRIFSL